MKSLSRFFRNAAVLLPAALSLGFAIASPPDEGLPPPPEKIAERLAAQMAPFTGSKEIAKVQQGPAGAAGMKGADYKGSGPVRIPCFLIWTKGEGPDLKGNERFLENCRKLLFSTAPKSPSVKAYLSSLFQSRYDFLNKEDLIPIYLPRSLDHYQSGYPLHLNTRFLKDLKVFIEGGKYEGLPAEPAAKGLGIDFSIFDNDKVETAGSKDNEIDIALFLFVTNKPMNCYRSWAEVTTDTGYRFTDRAGAVAPTFIRNLKQGTVVKLSSYCVGALFGAGEIMKPETELGGTGWINHEILHCFGLPDLYDAKANRTSGGCGSACVMGWGNYGLTASVDCKDRKAFPVLPSAWCRDYIGLVRPKYLDIPIPSGHGIIEHTITLVPTGSSLNSTCKINLPDEKDEREKVFDRYILVELRRAGFFPQKGEYDWDAPFGNDGGFLIWTVRERVGSAYVGDDQGVNHFWPMCYMGDADLYSFGRMNCFDNNPLVALAVPESGGDPPHNLDSDKLWKKDYLWIKDSPVFRTQDGTIALSEFDPAKGTFHCVVRGDGTELAANTTPVLPEPIANASAPASPDQAKLPELPQTSDLPVGNWKGNGLQLKRLKIPGKIGGLLNGVFKSYPEFSGFDVRSSPDWVTFALPVPKPGRNTEKVISSVKEQLRSMDIVLDSGKDEGNLKEGAVLVKVAEKEVTEFAEGLGRSVSGDFYQKYKGELVRIADSKLSFDLADPNEGKIFYKIDLAQSDLDIPNIAREITKEEFSANLRSRCEYLIKAEADGNIAEWERVISQERKTIIWQCRIPVQGGLGAVTIEMDAAMPAGGLTDETPVRIR